LAGSKEKYGKEKEVDFQFHRLVILGNLKNNKK